MRTRANAAEYRRHGRVARATSLSVLAPRLGCFPHRHTRQFGPDAGEASFQHAEDHHRNVLDGRDQLADGLVVDTILLRDSTTPPTDRVVRVGSKVPPPPLPADPTQGYLQAIAGSATSYCLTGHTTWCANKGPGKKYDSDTSPHFNGAFAQYYFLYPNHFMYKCPDEIPDAIAATLKRQ